MTVILYGDGEKTYTGTLYLNSGTGASQISTDGTLATNADSTLVSEKAIKTYVDAEHDKVDTLNTAGDTGTGTINLETETITFSGTTNETNTIASGQTITIGLTDDVTITDTLTVGGSLNVTGDITGVFPDSLVSDLSGYVPYTGADSTLNMGDEDIIVDTLKSMSLYDVSPEGLVLGMNFNTETINGSDVYDASFYNNHGTINNATPDSSAGFNDGGAITFTGTETSYVEIPDASSLDMTEAITLMAWAKDPPMWLAGWDYRRKITIESDNIDATLTDFPLLIALSDDCGISGQDLTGIFDRITTNSKKIALTTSDGTTQCYVEIEEWDNANQEAWLWARIPSISHTVDTELYLYYDNGHADNASYIGNTNSAAADSVWANDEYAGVWHMADGADNTHIYDSTPNNIDGTKKGTNEPILFAGDLDGSQDFDGSDDYIGMGDTGVIIESSTIRFYNDTIINAASSSSAILDLSTSSIYYITLGSCTGRLTNEIITVLNTAGGQDFAAYTSATESIAVGWHTVTIIRTGNVENFYQIWLDGVRVDNASYGNLAHPITANFVSLGYYHAGSGYFNGKITEVKIYSDSLTASFAGTENYNLNDNLNIFTAEESKIPKIIIDKVNYGINILSSDLSFQGNINAQGISADIDNVMTYHLYALTYDKTNIKLYLDGVQVATQAYTTAITANDSTLTIGKNFTGEIDDVSIYNRALSADEIWAYYANRVEVSDAYFSKNDASVDMIGDLTVAGNINGTFPDSLVQNLLGTENEITVTESPANTYTFKLDSDIFTLDANARVYVSGNNVYLGNQAGDSNTGDYGSFIGHRAGYDNTGGHGSFIGYYAGYDNTGNYGSFIGDQAGNSNTGDNGSFIGHLAGAYNKGHNNSGIGKYTLAYADSSYNVAIGYQASKGTSAAHFTFSNTTSLGANSMPTMSNQIMLGDTTVTEVKTYGAFVGDSLYTSGGAVITGTLDAPTLNTGQGDNELYAMDQDVETDDDVAFNSVTATTYVKGEHLESTDDAKVADSLYVGGNLTVDGIISGNSYRNPITVNVSTYTVLETGDYLFVDYTATGACTITLSTADNVDGYWCKIKDSGLNSGTNYITVHCEGALEEIEGSVDDFIIYYDGDAYNFTYHTDGWWVD